MVTDSSWWLNWIKRIGSFSLLQAVVQAANCITGFLLVRAMGKEDYAWFTIVNSLLATISVMADSGITTAFNCIGGPIYQERNKFSALLAFTMRLRLLFVGLSLVIAIPAGFYVLHLNHAPPWVNLILAIIILASAIPTAEIALLMAVTRLQGRLNQVLQADYLVAFSRLSLVSAGWFTGLNAVAACAITPVAQWLQVLLLRRQTREFRCLESGAGEEFRKPVMSVVRHMLPICVFQSVQGHITTWLLSVFADTGTVADVGALSRLGILSAFCYIPMQNIVVPRLARLSDTSRLRGLVLLSTALSLVVAVMIILCGLYFAKPVLWVFGPLYSHLTVELAWYMGFIALNFLLAVQWGVTLARGWVKFGWVHIPLTLGFQILGACLLDFSQARDVIIFAMLGSFASLSVAGSIVGFGILRTNRSTSPPEPPAQ